MTAKLLLVEDDRVERALMIEAIKGVSDADVVVMGDGRQALEYLRKNGPDSPDAPAVVFLDLSMPVVDGLGVLREFQRQANADRVPVVIFTASDAEADRDLGYEFGANAFVMKPMTPAKLQEVVQAAAAFWLHSNVRPPAR